MPKKPKSKVASLREQAGLTQVQLAVLVGVTPNTIQNWEKDDGLSQLEKYLKLAEVFGCLAENLVEYVETSEDEKPKSKGFSLQELRELRERWGTGTKAETETSKTNSSSPVEERK
jgi:transcriptional regulator with XRE-family HTH domain